jgi:hypothetical protein
VAAFKGGFVFIPTTESLNASSFIAHSEDRFARADRCAHDRWEKAYAAPAVPAPAIHPACCLAVRQAVAARRDPVGAAAPQAVDFPAGFPAAAPTAVPA